MVIVIVVIIIAIFVISIINDSGVVCIVNSTSGHVIDLLFVCVRTHL